MSAPQGYGMASPSGKTGNKIPSGYKQGQIQQFTPEQIQLFKQMFGHVGEDSYLSKLASGDQSFYNEMEAPALRQFNDISAGIANRFSGMGTGGRHSSGFQNAQTSAASNFAQDLQSRRQDLQRQAIQDLRGFSNDLLGQRPYEQFLVQKPQKQNPWAEIAGKFGGALPGAVAGYFEGGSEGAAQGVNAGINGFMNAFGKGF